MLEHERHLSSVREIPSRRVRATPSKRHGSPLTLRRLGFCYGRAMLDSRYMAPSSRGSACLANLSRCWSLPSGTLLGL